MVCRDNRSFDSAQDRPFDDAQDRPFAPTNARYT